MLNGDAEVTSHTNSENVEREKSDRYNIIVHHENSITHQLPTTQPEVKVYLV